MDPQPRRTPAPIVAESGCICNYRDVAAVRRSLVRARPPARLPQSNSGSLVGGSGGAVRIPSMRDSWPNAPQWPAYPYGATPADVAGLPAAGRALGVLAGPIAQMPIDDLRDDGTSWGPRPILDDPWPVMGRSEWLTYQVSALLMHGDAMALPADFDPDGFARQLVPIDPRIVDVRVDPDTGAVLYDIYTSRGVATLTRSDVWHAKGQTLTSDGLRGIGIVTQYRVAATAAVQLQQYGSTAFGQAVPSGIVKVHVREPSQKQVDAIKADWLNAFAQRVPAVLGELMDFTPISWSPEDMQYLEAARLSIADVAFMFNLDPSDLDVSLGSSMTYVNREQRAYDRLLTSIGPIVSKFEQAYRWLLPRGHVARFDRSIVTWSDAGTRATVQHQQLVDGTLTLNEAREQEGRPKYGPWADVPGALLTAQQSPPAPPPPIPAPELPAPVITPTEVGTP